MYHFKEYDYVVLQSKEDYDKIYKVMTKQGFEPLVLSMTTYNGTGTALTIYNGGIVSTKQGVDLFRVAPSLCCNVTEKFNRILN